MVLVTERWRIKSSVIYCLMLGWLLVAFSIFLVKRLFWHWQSILPILSDTFRQKFCVVELWIDLLETFIDRYLFVAPFDIKLFHRHLHLFFFFNLLKDSWVLEFSLVQLQITYKIIISTKELICFIMIYFRSPLRITTQKWVCIRCFWFISKEIRH